MSAGLVSSEASLLGWSMASFSCVLTWSALCMYLCFNFHLFYYYYFLLEHNCITMLRWFLLYNKVNQL